MKIAFVLSSCENSGPFIVARDIINNIYQQVEAIDIYYLKESAHQLHFNVRRKIKVSLSSTTDFSSYDIVHSHGFIGDVYAYLNRKSIRGKRITTLHQTIKPNYTLYYNALVGFVMEKVWCHTVKGDAHIVTLTNIMVDYYRKVIPGGSLVAIHNGTSPQPPAHEVPEAQQIRALKSKFKILGVSASLVRLKGIDRIIEALAQPGGEAFALLAIGDGRDGDEFKALAVRLGVGDRCLFVGHKVNAIDYFKYFDVYVMSSRSEGFGLCVIEAASQRVPVVCNELPVYWELFNDEVVRFKLDDLQSMITAIRETLEDHASYSNKIHARYVRGYTAEIMASRYLQLYAARSANELPVTNSLFS